MLPKSDLHLSIGGASLSGASPMLSAAWEVKLLVVGNIQKVQHLYPIMISVLWASYCSPGQHLRRKCWRAVVNCRKAELVGLRYLKRTKYKMWNYPAYQNDRSSSRWCLDDVVLMEVIAA